jgi:hypothetical protein
MIKQMITIRLTLPAVLEEKRSILLEAVFVDGIRRVYNIKKSIVKESLKSRNGRPVLYQQRRKSVGTRDTHG